MSADTNPGAATPAPDGPDGTDGPDGARTTPDTTGPDPAGNPPRDLHGRPYTEPGMRAAWYRVQAELAGPLTERSRAAIRRALRATDHDHDPGGDNEQT